MIFFFKVLVEFDFFGKGFVSYKFLVVSGCLRFRVEVGKVVFILGLGGREVFVFGFRCVV